MKNPVITICFIAGIVVFFSCKKDKTPDPTTISNQLQGAWKTTAEVDDDNGNGKIDGAEYVHTDSLVYFIYTFSKDSIRLQIPILPSDDTYPYTLSKDGKTILIEFDGTDDVLLYTIDTLTNDRLVLKDAQTNSPKTTWLIFDKQ